MDLLSTIDKCQVPKAKSNRPIGAFTNITSVCRPLVLEHVLIDRLIEGYGFGPTVAAALHARCP